MQYIMETARLLLPGLGAGFLIFSLVQGFAQPWWTLGLICCLLGVAINYIPVARHSDFRVKNRVLHVLEQYLPWITLIMVIITLVVSLLR